MPLHIRPGWEKHHEESTAVKTTMIASASCITLGSKVILALQKKKKRGYRCHLPTSPSSSDYLQRSRGSGTVQESQLAHLGLLMWSFIAVFTSSKLHYVFSGSFLCPVSTVFGFAAKSCRHICCCVTSAHTRDCLKR